MKNKKESLEEKEYKLKKASFNFKRFSYFVGGIPLLLAFLAPIFVKCSTDKEKNYEPQQQQELQVETKK